ncbi:hypothetical protein [Bradyrhizobium sp. 138]|uniref:hypothetical protein n=1 Tax=Bradyrhizobium sp. 138 TaxID=2782615 RepID=UPI001FFAF889|nr:hypothetical protein [Bradyrhizobium sp. 138]
MLQTNKGHLVMAFENAGSLMVDRLRSAAEHLEAPTCPDCHIEMRWYRSELLADEPVPIIAHLFVCPHCKRAAQADTIFKGAQAPPDKLSAPRFVAYAV